MVHLMNTGKVVVSKAAAKKGKAAAVKTEVEDPLEEAHAPLNKRSRSSSVHGRQSMGIGGNFSRAVALQYNPLEEPSPLGLRLRKSPSLLELIQMTLSQKSSSKTGGHGKKDQKGAGCSGSIEKLKASNFPASILRIGTWEYKSRYEGDLVAKCYFAKHKLVWEVLDGGLKNKIEIQWADIMALKANYPDDAPGTLDVVLVRPPLFYRETNPQPRKHTLWQATSDFTNGQASVHRRHYMQCPQGLLAKHFEKLIQCDPRLNFLSQQPELMLESPYFESQVAVFEDPSDTDHSFEVNTEGSSASFMRDVTSPSGVQSSTSMNEQDLYGRRRDFTPQATPSPSSVMDTGTIEEIKSLGAEQWRDLNNWNNIKVPGLHSSMSMSDLVSHLEHRISEQGTSNNITLSAEERQSLDILEDVSRCLFSDAQTMPASDEKSLMTRVNSLCCLLQKDPVTTLPAENDGQMSDTSKTSMAPACESNDEENTPATPTREPDDLFDCKQTSSSMSRKDSVGDLLLNLPRIASLPQIYCNNWG